MPIETFWITDLTGDESSLAELPPDLVLPKYARITVLDEPSLGIDVELAVWLNPTYRRYEVFSLTAWKRLRWDSFVDGSALRSIPVQELLRRGLNSSAQIRDEAGERTPMAIDEALVAEIRTAGPGSTEALTWAARIYVQAWALLEPPTAAVEQTLGLSRPSASIWVRRARERGILPDLAAMNEAESPLTREEYARVRAIFEA